MKGVWKIVQKFVVLMMDILTFTWQVVREVILPGRSRKGNVLSSLLIFFVGLLERAVAFERSILQRPVVFTHKYVKQALILAVGFLFLISSFEWTIVSSADPVGSDSPEVVTCAQAAIPVRTIALVRTVALRKSRTDRLLTGAVVADRFFIPALSPAWGYVMPRRWLRLAVFRI